MSFPFTRWLAMSVCVLLMASACVDTALNPDAATGGQVLTDVFSGTLTAQAQNHHEFVVKQAGAVTVVLTNVAPLSTIAMGLAVGTFDGTNCNTVVGTENINARVGSTIQGSAGAGNFCVWVYDVGNIVDPIDYTVQINHT
jgi:hypothetical protein